MTNSLLPCYCSKNPATCLHSRTVTCSRFRHTHSRFRCNDIHTCSICILTHPEPWSRERSLLAALCLESLESSQGERERLRDEGGRDRGREAGIKGDAAATSHPAHYLITSSQASGSRSVEEEGAAVRIVCVCVCWRESNDEVYIYAEISLSNICACIISFLSPTSVTQLSAFSSKYKSGLLVGFFGSPS